MRDAGTWKIRLLSVLVWPRLSVAAVSPQRCYSANHQRIEIKQVMTLGRFFSEDQFKAKLAACVSRTVCVYQELATSWQSFQGSDR
jgi:hypothetical protein